MRNFSLIVGSEWGRGSIMVMDGSDVGTGDGGGDTMW